MVTSASSGQLAGPDGYDKWADPRATFRLHEGVSHPSRADDLQGLYKLQKSAPKPKQGKPWHSNPIFFSSKIILQVSTVFWDITCWCDTEFSVSCGLILRSITLVKKSEMLMLSHNYSTAAFSEVCMLSTIWDPKNSFGKAIHLQTHLIFKTFDTPSQMKETRCLPS